MKTFQFDQLSEEAKGMVVAAQHEDVSILESGRVIAVISRPRNASEFA